MAALFGIKGSQTRIDGDAVELALDLTPEAVTLHERAASGGWKKFAAAALDDPEFQIVIGLLRADAEARMGAKRPVRLWLPGDQVLQRRARIRAQDEAGRLHEAFRFVADETVFRPDDVAIAVSPPGDGGEATILITFAETWREARSYAERWGFLPGVVSTRHRAGAFGAEGPAFRLRQPVEKPAVAKRRPGLIAAGAGAAAVAAAALLWNFWPVDPPPASSSPAPATGTTGTLAAAPSVPVQDAAQAPPAQVGPEPALTDPMRRVPGAAAFQSAALPASGGALPDPDAGLAPVRLAPWPGLPDAPQPVAPPPAPPAAHEPDPSGPEPAPPPTAAPAPPVVVAIETPAGVGAAGAPPGMVRLRQPAELPPIRIALADPPAPPATESEPQAAATLPVPMPPPRPAIVSADPPATALILPQAPAPTPFAAPAIAPQAGLGPAIAAPDPVRLAPPVELPPVPAAPAELSAIQAPESEPQVTAALPVPMPPPRPGFEADVPPESEFILPPPRPATETAPGPDPEPGSGVLATRPAPAAPAPEAPAPASGPGAPPAEAATAPPPQAGPDQPAPEPAEIPDAADSTDPDAPTELAAITAPIPPARPPPPAAPTATSLPIVGAPAPGTVRAAATDRGLPLDRTALIGILNLDGSRKALLRMPDGRYRSVIVGDVLDGWRVSVIGVDAMKVTKGGQDLTLVLVSR